jgi:hypothetical protein
MRQIPLSLCTGPGAPWVAVGVATSTSKTKLQPTGNPTQAGDVHPSLGSTGEEFEGDGRGGEGSERGAYPFSAPMVNPAMKYRCSAK